MADNETTAPDTSQGTGGAEQTSKGGRSFIIKDFSDINHEDTGRYYDKDGQRHALRDAAEDIIKFLKQEDKNNRYIRLTGDDFRDDSKEQAGLLSYYGGNDYSGKYVGLLMDGKTNDVYFLHSRFDTDEAYSFTNYLLSKALHINCRVFPDMRIRRDRDQFLQQLLALVFLEQIREAYKSGIFRCYRNFEENNSRVRGRIQVERNIKLNPIFNGRIAYTYREYTVDNDVNRIILTAYDYLVRKSGAFMRSLLSSSKYREVKTFFNQLGNIMMPASRQEVQRLLKNNKKKIRHSVYRKWEDVRKTAIQILRHMGIQTHESGQAEISGILINMTKIWEDYLEQVLRECKDKGFSFETQKSQNILEGRRDLRPDFLDRKNRIVLDAKYKNSWAKAVEDPDGSWPREDTFQILSYMYVYNCDIGGILCPVPEGKYNEKKLAYSVGGQLVGKFVILLPLQIPDGEKKSYAEFEAAMKEKEQELRVRLYHVIEAVREQQKSLAKT